MRDILLAWSVDCPVKPAIAKKVAELATRAYSVTDELFVWSDGVVRPMNLLELLEHERG
jgi:hypothetical protein